MANLTPGVGIAMSNARAGDLVPIEMGESLSADPAWVAQRLGIDLSDMIGRPFNSGSRAAIVARIKATLPPDSEVRLELDEASQVLHVHVSVHPEYAADYNHALEVALKDAVPAGVAWDTLEAGHIRIGAQLPPPVYPTRFERILRDD